MKKILILIYSCFLIFAFTGNTSFAYTQKDNKDNPNLPLSSLVNPLDFLKNDLLKSAAQNVGVSTAVPGFSGFKQILDTQNLSFTDISSSLKAIVVLAINLFLIVIQAVAAILKGLLPFLSR